MGIFQSYPADAHGHRKVLILGDHGEHVVQLLGSPTRGDDGTIACMHGGIEYEASALDTDASVVASRSKLVYGASHVVFMVPDDDSFSGVLENVRAMFKRCHSIAPTLCVAFMFDEACQSSLDQFAEQLKESDTMAALRGHPWRVFRGPLTLDHAQEVVGWLWLAPEDEAKLLIPIPSAFFEGDAIVDAGRGVNELSTEIRYRLSLAHNCLDLTHAAPWLSAGTFCPAHLTELPGTMGMLTSLELLHMDCHMTLPPEAALCTALQEIRISPRMAFRGEREEYAGDPFLQSVNLSSLPGAPLVAYPRGSFPTSVTSLSIVDSGLREIDEGILCLPNLTLLSLHNNEIVQLPPALTKLTKLAYITLDYNPVVSLPAGLSHLQHLRLLSARYSSLEVLPGDMAAMFVMGPSAHNSTRVVVESEKFIALLCPGDCLLNALPVMQHDKRAHSPLCETCDSVSHNTELCATGNGMRGPDAFSRECWHLASPGQCHVRPTVIPLPSLVDLAVIAIKRHALLATDLPRELALYVGAASVKPCEICARDVLVLQHESGIPCGSGVAVCRKVVDCVRDTVDVLPFAFVRCSSQCLNHDGYAS